MNIEELSDYFLSCARNDLLSAAKVEVDAIKQWYRGQSMAYYHAARTAGCSIAGWMSFSDWETHMLTSV